MITVQYACTRKEYSAGKKLLAAPARAAARRKKPLGLPSFFGWILFFFFAIIFFMLLRRAPVPAPAAAAPQSPTEPGIWTLWGLYASVLGVILLIVGLRAIRRATWLQFRQQTENVAFTFSDEGVEQNKPGVRTLIRWPYFSGLAENAAVFLLRQHGGEGIILPKSLFATADLAGLDKLLKEKLAVRVPTLTAGFEVRSA